MSRLAGEPAAAGRVASERPPRAANGDAERAGSVALAVFARVLSARVLRAHIDGPLASTVLERQLGWAPKASLRVAVGNLRALGALERVESNGQRGTVTRLTAAGRDLLGLAAALESWLARSPFGPIDLEDTAGQGVVRALTAGWDSAVVGALAGGPRTLSELSAEIPGHSYAALKRRLGKLRSADLVAPVSGGKRSPEHAVTEWLRFAAGPISVASRWEQAHLLGGLRPMDRGVMETIFLLALPLVALPRDVGGRCVLAALMGGSADGNGDKQSQLATVSLEVVKGQVTACKAGADATPTTWALGTPAAWFDAIVDGRADSLRLRGADARLVTRLVTSMHTELFPS